jgi:hypothetical protein
MYLNPTAAQNKIGGGLKIFTAEVAAQLEVLSLTGCGLTDEDVKDLASLPWGSLHSIWISYNGFGLKGV